MSDTREPLKSIITPVRLEYEYTAGVAATRFLRGLAEKKILGARSAPRLEVGRVGARTLDRLMRRGV